MSMHKRQSGRYYTKGNPFGFPAFERWAARAGLPRERLLEPFAGANDLVRTLTSLGQCRRFAAYDIKPGNEKVARRDTIKNFPAGFKACVTNPPWLAKNSATRRRLAYPRQSPFDDLYKHCLSLCLANCAYVAAIVPASFLQSGLFQERLAAYILLHGALFNDTENPACLALFNEKPTRRIDLYNDGEHIGRLESLRKSLPRPKRDRRARFNDPAGQLGFISFDTTEKPTIRFCSPDELAGHEIKHSCRFITRISGDFGNASKMISRLNRAIERFREETQDAFLTPFKGMRKDGMYRRRMEYALARGMINAA